MAALSCAFDSSTALRRVFIPSTRHAPNCLHVPRIFVPALLSPYQQQHIRCITGTSCFRSDLLSQANNLRNKIAAQQRANRFGADHFKTPQRASPAPSSATTAYKQPPKSAPVPGQAPDVRKPGPRVMTKLARLPRDDEIRAQYVYIQEKDADGEPRQGQLVALKQVLEGLDRRVESLQVVVDSNPKNPEAPRYPIAVVVNKMEELARTKKEKERQKQSAAATKEKELEINWAMAPHDVDHKLRTLQKFLAKGWRVQLLLLKKGGKGVQKASKKQGEELLEKLNQTVASVEGSKEWKRREGQVLGSLRVFLQGKRQKDNEEKEVFLTKKQQATMAKEKALARLRENGQEVKAEEVPRQKPEEAKDEAKEEDFEDDPVELISRRTG